MSVEQVELGTDPVHQLRTGARIIRRLDQHSWLVADILRSAHQTDPGLAETWQLWQQRHVHEMQRAVLALEHAGALQERLRRTEVVDSLYALTSTEVYRDLVRERGWSPARYERWLLRLVCLELLGITPDDPPSSSPA